MCIVGGGLAGTIAALSAARNGAQVVLIQDRPLLGGVNGHQLDLFGSLLPIVLALESDLIEKFLKGDPFSEIFLIFCGNALEFGEVFKPLHIPKLTNIFFIAAPAADRLHYLGDRHMLRIGNKTADRLRKLCGAAVFEHGGVGVFTEGGKE